jgi:hypothetical protein
VSQHFEEVRMLGQTPFVGYAIADFSAADASEVRIDTALLPGGAEEPEWFLALASALPVSPDAFSVIQLPLVDLELGTAETRAAEPEASEQLERAAAKIEELEIALAALAVDGAREAEKHAAERARDAERFASERARDAEKHAADRVRDAEKHANDRTRDAEKAATERSREGDKQSLERSRDTEKRERELEKAYADKLAALRAELEKREEWLAGLESRAATADERADQAQAELEQRSDELRKAKEQSTRLEHQLEEERRAKRQLEQSARAHEQELDKSKRRLEAEVQRSSELAAESKKLGARAVELGAALAESQKKVKLATEEGDEEVRAELMQLEASLKERAAEVNRLTAALHETERFGRELIAKVGNLESAREPAPPNPELDALKHRNAELSADLEAARWTISSLEANLGAGSTARVASSVATPAELGSPLSQRRDEIPPAEPLPLPRAD